MDINSWSNTWGTINWRRDSEDEIKEKITKFYHAGVDFNMKGEYYGYGHNFVGTPLCFAAGCSTVGVIDLLVDGGADINLDQGRRTPLHWAACHGKTENLKYLFEHGPRNKASFLNNTKDDCGWTALHEATFSKQTEIVKMLVEYGADVDIRCKQKKTPLILAAEGDCAEIAEILIENGANINVKNEDGQTVAFIAALMGHTETLRVLIEHGADVKNIKRSDYGATLGGMNEAAVKKLIENADKIRAEYLKKHSQGSLQKTLNNSSVKGLSNGLKNVFAGILKNKKVK